MKPVAMHNGQRMPLDEVRLAITDEGVARGDGAFETIGVWGGRPFRLDDHLARLAASLAALGLAPLDRDAAAADARALVTDLADDAALRVYVTASGTRVVTLTPQPVRPPVRALVVQQAPWIRPLGSYGPAGAKTMSYAANMAATRTAQRAGADDALLISLEGWVLEGPTFAVIWVADDRLYAPPATLGIIDSITRRTVLELAAAQELAVVEEPRPLDHLLGADEVWACSSVRDVIAVRRVDEVAFDGPAPLRDRMSAALEAARRGAATGAD